MVGAEQVLVVSPETDHHKKIDAATCKCGLNSYCCEKFDEARIFLTKQRFSVVFCHETLPDADFRGVIAAARPTPVVVLSGSTA